MKHKCRLSMPLISMLVMLAAGLGTGIGTWRYFAAHPPSLEGVWFSALESGDTLVLNADGTFKKLVNGQATPLMPWHVEGRELFLGRSRFRYKSGRHTLQLFFIETPYYVGSVWVRDRSELKYASSQSMTDRAKIPRRPENSGILVRH